MRIGLNLYVEGLLVDEIWDLEVSIEILRDIARKMSRIMTNAESSWIRTNKRKRYRKGLIFKRLE